MEKKVVVFKNSLSLAGSQQSEIAGSWDAMCSECRCVMCDGGQAVFPVPLL
jgi:hypothetical protein